MSLILLTDYDSNVDSSGSKPAALPFGYPSMLGEFDLALRPYAMPAGSHPRIRTSDFPVQSGVPYLLGQVRV